LPGTFLSGYHVLLELLSIKLYGSLHIPYYITFLKRLLLKITMCIVYKIPSKLVVTVLVSANAPAK